MTQASPLQVTRLSETSARIQLYGYIGDDFFVERPVTVAEFSKALNDLGSSITDLEVRINSGGGSAWAGLGIHDLLINHSARKRMFVDGVAASAASIVVVSGDEIIIPSNALLMIHDPANFAFGTADVLQKAVNELVAVKKSCIAAYRARTKLSESEISKMMSDETWLTGEEAVAKGFADRTSGEAMPIPPDAPQPPTNSLYSRYKRVPDQFSRLVSLSVPLEKSAMSTAPAAPAAATNPTNPAPAAPAPGAAAAPQNSGSATPGGGTTTTPAAPAAPAAGTSAPTLSAEDIRKMVSDAVSAGVTSERQRISEVTALCNTAGHPQLAQHFIETGADKTVVQAQLFTKLCESRPPVNTGATGATGADPGLSGDEKYKAEYAKQREVMLRMNVTEEGYIKSRRIDDGLDSVQSLIK